MPAWCLAIVALWSAVFSGVAVAESLSVTVKVKGTGEVITGANVVWLDGDIIETADNNGTVRFEAISLPGEIKILASGYETRQLFVRQADNPLQVYVLPVSMEEEGLVVVEDRVEEDTSKFVLTAGELRRVPGTGGDPLKAIQSMPGVVSTGRSVFMRGSGGGDRGVWVNNIPVDYLYHIGGDISTINPDLVEDFNLFLGGFPVEYPNLIGGFIDIKLRKPKNDRLHQQYRLAINEAAMLLEGPLFSARDSFYLAARRSYIDAVFTPESFTDLVNDGDNDDETQNVITTVPRYNDVQAMWHRELDNGQLFMQYLSASDEIALINNQAEESSPEAAGQLQAKSQYHSMGLGWRQALSGDWYTDSTVSYTYSKENQIFGTNPQTGESYYADVVEKESRIQPVLQWQPAGKNRVDVGVEGVFSEFPLELYISAEPTENDPNFDFTREEKYRVDKTVRATSLSPFVKYRRRWSERLHTQLGIRYAQIDGTGGIDMQGLTPRLTTEYQWNKALSFSAVWGRYMQMPATNSQLIEDFGNPRLEMTDAEHRILGMQYRFHPLWSAKVEAFHTPVKALSVRVPATQPPDNFLNEGEGETYGVDVFLKRQTQGGAGGWLSYSYAHSTRTNNLTGEERLYSGDIPHNLNVVWTQPLPGGWRSWQWGIKLQVRSGRPYTPVTGRRALCYTGGAYTECADQTNPENDADFSYWVAEYDKHNNNRLPLFYRLDFRIEKQARFNEWMLNYYLDFQNITFAQNVLGYDYGKNYRDYDNPKEILSTPFLPFFGVEFTF